MLTDHIQEISLMECAGCGWYPDGILPNLFIPDGFREGPPVPRMQAIDRWPNREAPL